MYEEMVYLIICIYDFVLIYIVIQQRIEEKAMEDWESTTFIEWYKKINESHYWKVSDMEYGMSSSLRCPFMDCESKKGNYSKEDFIFEFIHKFEDVCKQYCCYCEYKDRIIRNKCNDCKNKDNWFFNTHERLFSHEDIMNILAMMLEDK